MYDVVDIMIAGLIISIALVAMFMLSMTTINYNYSYGAYSCMLLYIQEGSLQSLLAHGDYNSIIQIAETCTGWSNLQIAIFKNSQLIYGSKPSGYCPYIVNIPYYNATGKVVYNIILYSCINQYTTYSS